jgi:hypothetical protein
LKNITIRNKSKDRASAMKRPSGWANEHSGKNPTSLTAKNTALRTQNAENRDGKQRCKTEVKQKKGGETTSMKNKVQSEADRLADSNDSN